MVGIHNKRCLHSSCAKGSSFNFEGSKRGAYCKQHAEDGMVDVRSRLCSNESCTTRPSFNIKGSKTGAYCRQHAEDGMVNVNGKRCSHDSCSKEPSFNVKDRNTSAYCKENAEDDMVNVRTKRCSHTSCLKRPGWGVLTDGVATSCLRHKGDIVSGPVINFRRLCKTAGCKSESRWGFDGTQPTHCRKHGPLQVGLVCTVGGARSKSSGSPSYGAVRGPSFRVKTECCF
ncbi:unnamed protein product [Laminaria digitata]